MGRTLKRALMALSLPFAAVLAMPSPSPARAAQPAARPYEIPVIEALTGGGAFLGKAEGEGLALFEKAINAKGGIRGRPLKFVYHDDQTNPQVAVQLASQIIEQHPAVVMVSSVVASCKAVMPLFQDHGPVMYCFAPGIRPRPGSYVYSMGASTPDLCAASLRYFRSRGWKRVAILTSTDASGQDAANALKEVLARPENKEMTVVARESFNTSDVTVAAQLARIKAAKPQVLIAWSTGAPIGTVFRGIEQAGLNLPVETTDGNMTYAQMTQYAAFLPKALYIHSTAWMVDGDQQVKLPAAVRAKQDEFYAAFRAAGVKPDVAITVGWEPGSIIAAALNALGPAATAPQLNAYLQHLKNFAGVAGIYDFEKTPQRGLDVSDAVVTRWSPKEQRWQPVSQLGGAPIEP